MSDRGREVRLLMRSAVTVALGTTLVEPGGGVAGSDAGRAYTSLALSACCSDGSPLLLLSALAQHTKNIDGDDRVALLYDGTLDLTDRLTGARASVLGRARKLPENRALGRFVARHPSAAGYADFGDFSLYKITVERAHVVAGFGAIHWVDGNDIIDPDGADIAAQEAGVLAHMNDDHGDAVGLIGARLGTSATPLAAIDSTVGVTHGDEWRMFGIDSDGCDLRQGTHAVRANFEAPLTAASDVRAAMVALTKRARETPAQA